MMNKTEKGKLLRIFPFSVFSFLSSVRHFAAEQSEAKKSPHQQYDGFL
jgi:hypothetical protein